MFKKLLAKIVKAFSQLELDQNDLHPSTIYLQNLKKHQEENRAPSYSDRFGGE